jgi:hypothetical protein
VVRHGGGRKGNDVVEARGDLLAGLGGDSDREGWSLEVLCSEQEPKRPHRNARSRTGVIGIKTPGSLHVET